MFWQVGIGTTIKVLVVLSMRMGLMPPVAEVQQNLKFGPFKEFISPRVQLVARS